MEDDDEKLAEHFAEVYRSVCSIPVPVTAKFIPHGGKSFIIESKWSTHDFGRMSVTAFNCTYFGAIIDTSHVYSSVLHDNASLSLTAISTSGLLKAVIREEKDASVHQYLDIWRRNKKVLTYDMLKCKLHGKIYDDEIMGTLSWNDTEDTLLYVAERLVPESQSFFKKLHDLEMCGSMNAQQTTGEEYAYREDWGETYTGKSHTVLCTLNRKTRKVNVLPVLQEENVTLCEPIWTTGGKSIYFVAYDETPYRLGIKFCNNRQSNIYHYDLETGKLRLVTNTAEKISVRSPRISPDNNALLFLQNEVNGPHFTCSKLVKCTLEGMHVVVDTVECGGNLTFPGIYTERFPERCFSKDGRYIFFSTIWHCHKAILCVNLTTNYVQKIPVEFHVSSCTVLDVFDDIIIASVSAPNIEPFLIAGRLCFDKDIVTALWSKLDKGVPRFINDIKWSVQSFEPPGKSTNYAHLTYDAIILTPKECQSSTPVILFPHGGPHSSHITSFNVYAAAFVKLGYAVFLVNYRGSIGYGADSINSLLGNVGHQDVNDVYYVLKCMREEDERFAHEEVFLFGGSHGGFIVAHLSAKYPEEFAASVCRNPVIDISTMSGITDIPDWTWVECGKSFNYSLPDHNALSDMWKRSPIRHVDENKVPTLLLLGKEDRRVPFYQGLKYYHALKNNNVPVKVYMYDDGHGLTSFAAQSDGFMQSALWFYKYRIKSVLSSD